jgi:hypothetical protein
MRAFDFIQMLRLKNQQRCYERGAVMHNHVNPSELDPAERRALLDALRQAVRFKNVWRWISSAHTRVSKATPPGGKAHAVPHYRGCAQAAARRLPPMPTQGQLRVDYRH